jgi:predicted DNA-binding transcriptional regulator AlpA
LTRLQATTHEKFRRDDWRVLSIYLYCREHGGILPCLANERKTMTARHILSPDQLQAKGITLGNDQRKNLEQAGRFPRRVPITERTHGYVEEEIDSYLERRIVARDDH